MKKNNRISLNFVKFNYYFSKKNTLLIFLLILVGCLIPTLSGSESFNFWYKLLNILRNPIFNMLFFIAVGLNVIYLISDFSKSYEIISRYQNVRKNIDKNKKDIFIYTIYISFISLLIAISGAIIFSFGDFAMLKYYNLPIIYYIIFYFIRNSIIAGIINVIIYYLFMILKKISITILILLNSLLFTLLPISSSVIKHFYNMKLLYHYYFLETYYETFFLEIICSLLEILILVFFSKIIYSFIIKKRRDLI